MAHAPRLGATVTERGVTFRLWSTDATTHEVRLYDATGTHVIGSAPLASEGAHVFAATVAGVGHGARYRFVLDGHEVGDPYARWLPDGVLRPAMVYAARHRFIHAPVARPLREHVIYELHVGTFTPAGTYAAAAAHLRALAQLGVTAIELMPVAAFAGHHGWGYDGVAPFAPHAAYGTPDELRALVDAAHGVGLAVLLDVVYNHFGPAGNDLAAYSRTYVRDAQTGWGEAPDFRQPAMRALAVASARDWLEAYQLDGLRIDAVHALIDDGERHILREITDAAHALGRPVLVIAEDERNEPALVERLGVDGIWADDFHHAVHVTLTGERDGYYAAYAPGAGTIARAIERGWLYEGQVVDPRTGRTRGTPALGLPAEAFVYCLQNHDQVGNRALGERLHALVPLEAYAGASTLLLFLPMTPVLFMGQEWAASTPFQYFTDHAPALGAQVAAGRREEFKAFRAFADPAARAAIPDPQDPATHARSTLAWAERERPPHGRVLALYQALLALRRTDPVLVHGRREQLSAHADEDLLIVRRWHAGAARTLLWNLSAHDRAVAVAPVARVLVASRPVRLPVLPAWAAVVIDA